MKALELPPASFLEMGQMELAQAVSWAGDISGSTTTIQKYLHIAQILQGRSLEFLYRKGIEIIKNKIATLNPDDHKCQNSDVLHLSNTYVSISEIYMTDLATNRKRKTESKSKGIDLSVSTDPTNPEFLKH